MPKKFFIIAGEASGDLLGSKLIVEIKQQNPDAEFIGVGGKLMQEQGLASIFPMEELSIMGFLEVVPHIAKILRRIKQTAAAAIAEKPDFMITIDSPDFCFRVMKKLKSFSETKKIHLIAPSVWAYRENRAEKIAKLYDLLLAILPFEPPYFEKYGLKTAFIGHPIVEKAPNFSKKEIRNITFRKRHHLKDDDYLISVTPGSRRGEVEKIFPEFIAALNLLLENKPNLKVIIPLVDKTRDLVKEMSQSLKMEYVLVEGDEKEDYLFASDFALAKSGTNTVEFSLYRIPMIIAYKINALTHFFVKRMVKIKFANLVNLILNKEIIPEMLQYDCNAEKIHQTLKILVADKALRQKQIDDSQSALTLMGLGNLESSSQKAVQKILEK